MISRERLISIASLLTRFSLAAIIFLLPIYFAWFQENFTVFDLNKSAALHLFLAVAFIAWLLEAALRGRFIIFGGRRLIGLFGILGVVFLLSTLFSLHPQISLWGSYERQQGLYNLWHYIVFSFLVIQSLGDESGRKMVLRSLMASSALVCLYGLAQAFGLDPLSWGENPQERIFSSFGQPNFLGHFLVVVLPLTLFACAWLKVREAERLVYRLLVGAQLACLLFTYSRSAWLALAVTIFFFLLWLLFRNGRRKTAFAVVALAIVMAAVLIFSPLRQTIVGRSSGLQLSTVSRLTSFLDLSGGSNRIRLFYWQAVIKDFEQSSWERKLIGYGPDTIASVYVRYYDIDWGYYESLNSFPDRAHNLILDIVLQFGLFGLVAFVCLTTIALSRLWRALKGKNGEEYWFGVALFASFLAYGINNLFSFSLTAMALIFFLLIALAWSALGRGEGREYTLDFFRPASRGLIIGSVTVFLFVLIYSYSIKPLVADYYYFQVKKDEAIGDCRAMMTGMEKVMSWYPLSHYYQRAYLHHGTNCFSAAPTQEAKQNLATSLLEEAALIPDKERQFYTVIDLAHMYSLLAFYIDAKYYVEAEKYYRQLLDVNPNITVTYQDYGRLMMWQERYDEALALYEQGLAVTPSLVNPPPSTHLGGIAYQRGYFHELIGSVYEAEKKSSMAEAEYRLALADNPRQSSAMKRLADLAYARKDIHTAIEYNRKGFDIEPMKAIWPFSLATLYKEKSDKVQALEYARQAVVIEPTNTVMKTLLTELEKKQ